MAFKLKPPYDTVIPNVYFRDMEDGELGRAEKNGTIILNEEMKDPSQIDEVIGHEKNSSRTNAKRGFRLR